MPQQPWTFGQPDNRSTGERLEDLRSVQRQVRSVMVGREDAALNQRLLSTVERRRVERDDPVKFGEIPDRRGGSTLAKLAELLVRTESVGNIDRLLALYRLEAEPITGLLDGRVTRLKGPDQGLEELAALAATLRRQGVAISANYMTPLGPASKSVAGPELSSASKGPVSPVPKRSRLSRKPPVRVAIIDTGVTGRRGDGWINDLATRKNRERLDAKPADGYLDFAAGHGTFVAGVVQQIAPDAEIVVVKAVDSDGYADEVAVAEAIVQAAKDGLKAGQHTVINLSLGAATADDERPIALGVATEIVDELQLDQKWDVLLVAAAGNFGDDRPCYPAALPNVLAVGAVTQGLLPAPWSSRGPWVDMCTIGEGVRSAYVAGTESPAYDPDPDTFGKDAWALWTGTSFAAPQVAGALARIVIDGQKDKVDLQRARWLLTKDAPEIPLYGKRVEILPRI